MKKTLNLKKSKSTLALGAGIVLALSTSVQAQTTIGFESINLSAESFWDGSQGFGGFVVEDAIFPNTYNSDWDYWEAGFALSNITDNSKTGSEGLYIAQPFEGVNNSVNYALGQNGTTLEFLNEQTLDSIYVSNNVYAASIMKDGDGWIAKQFGSTTNAAGDDDGTNGEDWFMLRIIGFDDEGLKTDSVDFYLADYRFADNKDDYILDTWQKIELSTLGNVKSVQFNLLSSDMSGVWLNTPSFFTLDNVSYSEAMPNLVEVNQLSNITFSLYPNPATEIVQLNGAPIGERVQIYNALGKVVLSKTITSSSETIQLADFSKGIYLVELLGSTQQLIIK